MRTWLTAAYALQPCTSCALRHSRGRTNKEATARCFIFYTFGGEPPRPPAPAMAQTSAPVRSLRSLIETCIKVTLFVRKYGNSVINEIKISQSYNVDWLFLQI